MPIWSVWCFHHEKDRVEKVKCLKPPTSNPFSPWFISYIPIFSVLKTHKSAPLMVKSHGIPLDIRVGGKLNL
jgi:hypothetical protein